MEISKCMGCMSEFRGYPCPDCGYTPGKQPGQEYALPPETILGGKYLVGRVLGQGGFGITYIGWDIALERKVAIKEYYPSGQVSRAPGTRTLTWYTSDSASKARQDGMQMFLKEARKMAKVDRIPNVVRILDLFQENETAYIVMDFVEGQTLKSILQKRGPMGWEQAKGIFLPAIRAMEKVHKAGLVHRDLSPDNLMLTPEGEVMILDLGAAKDLNINSGASSMQVAKGGFSPYEQYTQRGGSGPWTDVYAMAATIYYTLTGKVPSAAMDRMEEDTLRWDLPNLLTLPAPALEALKRAMAVLAKQRTQTMGELETGLFAQEPKPEPPKPVPLKPEPKPEPPKPKPPKPMPTLKNSKKLRIALAVLLFCLITFGILFCWGRYSYEENDTGITITGYENLFGMDVRRYIPGGLTIPEKINEQPVTSIGTFAFYNCSKLSAVSIPDSVTSIENYAFSDCDSLTSVSIPNSVTSIEYYTFSYCDSLTSVSIPNSVTSIESDAFFSCDSLTSITIPDSVTYIGESAFHDCDSLTSITIPDSVTYIGKRAFYDCDSLTSITIPDSVKEIGDCAFAYCNSLTRVDAPSRVLFQNETAFKGCTHYSPKGD